MLAMICFLLPGNTRSRNNAGLNQPKKALNPILALELYHDSSKG